MAQIWSLKRFKSRFVFAHHWRTCGCVGMHPCAVRTTSVELGTCRTPASRSGTRRSSSWTSPASSWPARHWSWPSGTTTASRRTTSSEKPAWTCPVRDGRCTFHFYANRWVMWHVMLSQCAFCRLIELRTSCVVDWWTHRRRFWRLRWSSPLKIWRRGESMFWPLKCHVLSFKLLLDNSASFTSSRMKYFCQKWKVKLIFRSTDGLSGTEVVECLEIIDVGCNL